MQILGVDVGGTGIKAAIVDTSSGQLLGGRIRIPTPSPANPEAVGKVIKTLLDRHQWSGPVGIGFPSVIQHGVARTAANIDKSFIDFPVRDFFARQTGGPVYMANDADAAGLAEMRFGAGRGHAGVVLIVTIGTGLGTALFCGGRLLPNTELGHIFLANGHEAERYASEAVRVTRKLKWKDWGTRLNLYLSTLEQLVWPDLIVLGGGVSEKLPKFSLLLCTKAPVVAASFLNQAGIVGAALFAEDELIRSASGSG